MRFILVIILKKLVFNAFYYIARYLRVIYLSMQGARISFGSKIDPGYRFSGVEYISLSGEVRIGPSADIFLIKSFNRIEQPILSILNNSYIGRNFHLVATAPISFGENLLVANNVFISNCRHGIDLNNTPFKDQLLMDYGPIIIGSNVWIGEGASIIGSLNIGNNVVIGNGECVLLDLPDNSIFKNGVVKIRDLDI